MEAVRITKKMLKLHPCDLLVKLNAVSKDGRFGLPTHVYFSKEDYKELKNNLKKSAKKSAPSSPERLVSYSVGVDLLNYGPNENLGDVLKPGWALVDREAIEKENG